MVIAVIGKGMIGAAAARHLALMGEDVLLIGPDEPQDYASHPGVFASHYDEARITRSLDPYPFWSRVSRESIARYSEIERASGIRFFTETGLLMAGPDHTPLIRAVERGAQRDNIHCEALRGQALQRRFPYFQFSSDTLGLFEPRGAGHINPRLMVRAHSVAAQKLGAHVITAMVTGLRETADGVEIDSTAGHLSADQVLVAAGGFTNELLPEPLPLHVYARTVLLAEVAAPEQNRLREMPPLIYLEPDNDPYLLPPVAYPDGRVYLKIGGDPVDLELPGEAECKAWFRSGGDPEIGDHLLERLQERMPDLAIASTKIAPCITTFTNSIQPVLQRQSDRISVATGGSGRGAKCSDELGRLGALVARGAALPDWVAETCGS